MGNRSRLYRAALGAALLAFGPVQVTALNVPSSHHVAPTLFQAPVVSDWFGDISNSL